MFRNQSNKGQFNSGNASNMVEQPIRHLPIIIKEEVIEYEVFEAENDEFLDEIPLSPGMPVRFETPDTDEVSVPLETVALLDTKVSPSTTWEVDPELVNCRFCPENTEKEESCKRELEHLIGMTDMLSYRKAKLYKWHTTLNQLLHRLIDSKADVLNSLPAPNTPEAQSKKQLLSLLSELQDILDADDMLEEVDDKLEMMTKMHETLKELNINIKVKNYII